ncbi:zinc finger protein 701-like [Planococcus citri]|uniref:zinc finger protein 701-like n=1 Tax=Planococcus citri TaxID=170843 RepID=UPI0031F9091F
MNYVYEYEDSMNQYEKLLMRNFAKLKFLNPSSESEFSEMEGAYITIKKYLDAAQENMVSLKAEYHDLNQHYSCLFEVEDNVTEELPNYLRRQEALRLKFLEVIYESKRINSCLDDILYGSPVETLERDSIQSPLERFHAAHCELSKAVELESSSVWETNMSPRTIDYDDSDPHMRMDDDLETSFTNEYTEELVTAVGTQSPESAPLNGTEFVPSKRNKDSRLVVNLKNSKAIICDICGRNFKHKYYLKRHIMAVHEKLKPFSCAECGKSFSRKQNMRIHILQEHISKRHYPFVCSICDRKFACKSHLNRHTILHENPKPFDCTLCDKSFTRKEHVKSHVLVKHTPKHRQPFVCNICDRRFGRRADLKKHTISHEKQETF